MEINIIKEDKTKLEIEIVGEDHTLCNALRRELWKNKDIKAAAYNIEHPLVSQPRFIVQTNKEDPKKALIKASKSLNDEFKKFKDLINKQLK